MDMDLVEPDTFGEKGFSSPATLLSWLESNIPESKLSCRFLIH